MVIPVNLKRVYVTHSSVLIEKVVTSFFVVDDFSGTIYYVHKSSSKGRGKCL